MIDTQTTSHEHEHEAGAGVAARLADPIWIGIFLFTVFFCLYSVFALRIAEGDFLDHMNLLFDLDPKPYADKLTKPAAEWRDGTHGSVKHPFIPWFSPLTIPAQIVGLEWKQSASLFAAFFGALGVALAFHVFMLVGTVRIDAILLSSLYGISATSLFNGFIVESYVIAAVTIIAIWYLVLLRWHDPGRYQLLSVMAGVMAFGVTVTNVIQAGLAEMFVRFRHATPVFALRQMILFVIAVCTVIFLAVAITWPGAVWFALTDPIGAAKQIYWLRTSGPKTDPSEVIVAFFAFTYAAPGFDKILLPEGLVMHDFRTFTFGWGGTLMIGLWLTLWAALTVLALRWGPTRWIAAGFLAALLFNVLLHFSFQFRLSVFMYTSHAYFLLVACTAGGLAFLYREHRALAWGSRAILTALIIFAAANNLPRAWEGATAFDGIELQPTPPDITPQGVVLPR